MELINFLTMWEENFQLNSVSNLQISREPRLIFLLMSILSISGQSIKNYREFLFLTGTIQSKLSTCIVHRFYILQVFQKVQTFQRCQLIPIPFMQWPDDLFTTSFFYEIQKYHIDLITHSKNHHTVWMIGVLVFFGQLFFEINIGKNGRCVTFFRTISYSWLKRLEPVWFW